MCRKKNLNALNILWGKRFSKVKNIFVNHRDAWPKITRSELARSAECKGPCGVGNLI